METKHVFFKFEIEIYVLVSFSFEYLCYGSASIINISILSVRGLSSYVSESDVKTVPTLKGLGATTVILIYFSYWEQTECLNIKICKCLVSN